MNQPTADSIRDALRFIPSDCDRDLWVRMAMATKAALGESGFDTWDAWSQGADCYDAKAARDTWKSVDPNGQVTVATLYWEAKQRGFKPNGSGNIEQSREEIERYRRERAEAQAKYDAERQAREAKAKERAAALWEAAKPIDQHPYLASKNVKAHGLRVQSGELAIADMQCDGAMILPARIGNEIHSLQFINAKGEKRYLPDANKAGKYFCIGSTPQAEKAGGMVICEGYATGASIFEADRYPALVAFDAGNLLLVAKAIRERYPSMRLIVAADNDRRTVCKRHKDEGLTVAVSPLQPRPDWCRCNPGLTAALQAARAVSGALAVPDFQEDDPAEASDMNDLARLHSAEAVRKALGAAIRPLPINDRPAPELSASAPTASAANDRLASEAEIMAAAPAAGTEAVPAQAQAKEPEAGWPQSIDLEVLAEREPERPKFIIPDWFPAGYATLFAGHGGVGKSGIALHLSVCMAAGVPFFGMSVERRRVLYLSCEDREAVLHWRLTRICAHLGINMAGLRGWLEVIDLVGADTVLWERDPRTGHTVTPALGQLEDRIKQYESEVIVVDGISDTFAGNENARTEVKRFVNALVGLIPQETGAVLLVGHIAKIKPGAQTTEGYSGSTGWHNSVRARWYLYPETEAGEDNGQHERTGDLILELQKSNLGRTDQEVRFRWDDQAHLFVGRSAEPQAQGGIVGHLRDKAIERVVIDGLRSLAAISVTASEKENTQRYLPKLLMKYKFAGDYTKADLGAAMRRLIVDGTLKIDKVGKYANRDPMMGLIVTDGDTTPR